MELNVDINPEKINKEISEAIAKSAIGKELERVIVKQVELLGEAYHNPWEGIVKSMIHKECSGVITENYGEQIKRLVSDKMTEKFVSELFDRMWRKFHDQY